MGLNSAEIMIADYIAEMVVEKLKSAEHDGCKGCAFEDVEEWEMPCCKCKQGCKDYWRAKGEEK